MQRKKVEEWEGLHFNRDQNLPPPTHTQRIQNSLTHYTVIIFKCVCNRVRTQTHTCNTILCFMTLDCICLFTGSAKNNFDCDICTSSLFSPPERKRCESTKPVSWKTVLHTVPVCHYQGSANLQCLSHQGLRPDYESSSLMRQHLLSHAPRAADRKSVV